MMQWYKKHPSTLRTESDVLKTNNNYRETIQVRDNLFISHGFVLVRKEKVYKFPILVVYTDATPYELPFVYPLKDALPDEFVRILASLSLGDLQQKLNPYIHFRYELRHQNASGALCILEWDNLDDGPEFFGVHSILDRVRQWFRGTITGEFPPDSQEVEFCAHFNNVDHSIKFIYPEQFLDAELVEGDAYAVKYSFIPKRGFYPNDRTIYSGALLTGKKKSGLFENTIVPLPSYLVENGITTLVELETKAAQIERLVANGDLLKMPWFQVAKEPTPFKTFNELITIIGDGDLDRGKRKLFPYLFKLLKTAPSDVYLAIRYYNRKEDLEFQVFRVFLKKDPPVVLIDKDDNIVFDSYIDRYEEVAAIEGEKLTDNGFHMRNEGRAERSLLKTTVLNMAGVGAIGSEISDSMGKAGVGRIRLFDNQLVKAQNTVRHLAGLEHIGFAKVVAVADIIHRHNPFVVIDVDGRNINRSDLNDIFPDGSITISSIADDNTEAFLNERSVIANKTVYYVRALRGGKAARIFRVIPGQDACFNCLENYKQDKHPGLIIPADPALPTLKNECNNPIRPASAADLKLIAAMASRVVLDELQTGFAKENHWIWSTEDLETFGAYTLHKQQLAPHPECVYCTHEHKYGLEIPNDRLKFMQAQVAENNQIETGGVMAGYRDKNKIVVTHVSGPGPNAIRSATEFQKDVPFCQAFLDDLFKEHGNKAVYVGEWHSHPCLNNKPSNTDIKSLTEISNQKEYLTDHPAMIILNKEGHARCTVHPAGKLFYETTLLDGNFLP